MEKTNIGRIRPNTEDVFNAGDERLLAAVAGCIASDLNSGRRVAVCGSSATLSALKPHLVKNDSVRVVGPRFPSVDKTSAVPSLISAARDPKTNVLLMPNTSAYQTGFSVFGYDTLYSVSANMTCEECVQIMGRFLRKSPFHDSKPFSARIAYDEHDDSMSETSKWLESILAQHAKVTMLPLQAILQGLYPFVLASESLGNHPLDLYDITSLRNHG